MLLTLTTTHRPATDLGYLLHKSPFRIHTFEEPPGKACVFYPEATEERCSATLMLDIDAIGLVRKGSGAASVEQYVNDRPYVASSFLSVAIGRIFGTALTGRSKERQELADSAIPFEAHLPAVYCRAGDPFLRRLFEPLGYEVTAARLPLDEKNPDWGDGPYFSITLKRVIRLKDLLAHLYVLIPVLDDEKHYWVGDDEVEKLLRRGEGWLETHPEKELIALRYLKHYKHLAREALTRLSEDQPDADEASETHAREEEVIEKPISLNEQRLGAVISALHSCGAKRVLDLGCGEGRLLRELLRDRAFTEIVGMDVSHRALDLAAHKLRLDQLPAMQRERIRLLHGSLTYRDKRLEGFDAACVVEVVEHQDPPRLAAFERVLFEFAQPKTVVMTTPNVEYNVRFETLPAGKLRHKDHRFEWTRAQFQSWASAVAGRFGYSVGFVPVGPQDPALGSPTQMGIFNLP